MNAFDLDYDLSDLLGEASSASHWSRRLRLRTINRIQQRIYMRMSLTLGDWFVKKSSSLTPSSGEITPPADMAKPVYLREVNSPKNEIPINLTVRDIARTEYPTLVAAWDGALAAYMLSDKIVVNKSDYSAPVYLWYEQRCINLHAGTAAAGGATSLTLEDGLGHSVVDDYYNGLYLEAVGGTGEGTKALVTDYVGSTRVLTLDSGTFASDTEYGLVSVLPDEGYDALLQQAFLSCLAKPSGVISEEFLKAAAVDAREAKMGFFDWVQTRVQNNIYLSGAGEF